MSPGSVSVPVSQGQTTLQILLQPSQPGTTGHVENIGPGLSPQHNPTIVQQQPRGVISASYSAIRSQLMVSYFTIVNEALVVAASLRKLTMIAKKLILTRSGHLIVD